MQNEKQAYYTKKGNTIYFVVIIACLHLCVDIFYSDGFRAESLVVCTHIYASVH